MSYLYSLLLYHPYRYERDTLQDTPRCAGWPLRPCRRHSRCCLARHTKRSPRGTANTSLALCPQRTSPDSLARTGPRGESDTPHSLRQEHLINAGRIYCMHKNQSPVISAGCTLTDFFSTCEDKQISNCYSTDKDQCYRPWFGPYSTDSPVSKCSCFCPCFLIFV